MILNIALIAKECLEKTLKSGKVVTEAEPALSKFCKADEKKFLKKCAPQISIGNINFKL